MSAGVKITKWRGREVAARYRDAQRKGINTTLADATAHAQLPFPVGARRLTGLLANSLTFEPAVQRGNGFAGSFGGYTVNYTLWRELEDQFLRRAADAIFPQLADNIRAEL